MKENKKPIVKICYADDTPCWKCGEKMKSVYGLIGEQPISPDDFTDKMVAIAREKGVQLQNRKSNVTGETHLVNVCEHCGAFIGEFYLHDLWYEETEVIEVSDAGYMFEQVQTAVLFYNPIEIPTKIRVKSTALGIDATYEEPYYKVDIDIGIDDLIKLAADPRYEEVSVYLTSHNQAYTRANKKDPQKQDVVGWFSLKGIKDGGGYLGDKMNRF